MDSNILYNMTLKYYKSHSKETMHEMENLITLYPSCMKRISNITNDELEFDLTLVMLWLSNKTERSIGLYYAYAIEKLHDV